MEGWGEWRFVEELDGKTAASLAIAMDVKDKGVGRANPPKSFSLSSHPSPPPSFLLLMVPPNSPPSTKD
jgi:hypothetical protein